MIKNCPYRTQTDQHKIKECTIHVLNQISVDEPRDWLRNEILPIHPGREIPFSPPGKIIPFSPPRVF